MAWSFLDATARPEQDSTQQTSKLRDYIGSLSFTLTSDFHLCSLSLSLRRREPFFTPSILSHLIIPLLLLLWCSSCSPFMRLSIHACTLTGAFTGAGVVSICKHIVSHKSSQEAKRVRPQTSHLVIQGKRIGSQTINSFSLRITGEQCKNQQYVKQKIQEVHSCRWNNKDSQGPNANFKLSSANVLILISLCKHYLSIYNMFTSICYFIAFRENAIYTFC